MNRFAPTAYRRFRGKAIVLLAMLALLTAGLARPGFTQWRARRDRSKQTIQQVSQEQRADPAVPPAIEPDQPRLAPPDHSETAPVRRPAPPAPQPRYQIPMAGPEFAGRLDIQMHDGLISLIVRDAPLRHVLDALARGHGLNIVTAENINARISMNLVDVPLEDALTAILSVAGYSWTRQRDIILVTDVNSASKLAPHAQGRQLRVFPLDFITAADAQHAVQGLLSPVGQAFISVSAQKNNRSVQDLVVVEDLPAYVDRIEQYLMQVDQPPRQVLIEAHVLQVELKDDYVNGVSFLYDDFKPGGRNVSLEAAGFSNPLASQAFFFTFESGDLELLVELLQVTTDAKTLASPKVLVVNGQEARIQVGESIGFRVTTTTQTSTLESVDFLDVGVVLRVTPHISRDNQVLMHVKPEVSSGRLNPDTRLPEEETTEVETDVLLPDGKGMVIGGLIQEEDSTTQSKIPIVGDLPLMGRLFQRQEVNRGRSEIIIVLIPRVAPYGPNYQPREDLQVHRATTPLLHGRLEKMPRPWEPRLYDAIEDPRSFKDLIPRVNLPSHRGRHDPSQCATCRDELAPQPQIP